MDFPLKSDFFPQVRLSDDEKAKYLRTVEASAIALRRSLAPHGSDWKKLYDREGVAFSKAHFVREELDYGPPFARTGAATACLAVCATIYTSGTISEVLEAIASPVTEDYRKAMKFIYKSRFIDGLGLHTIMPSGSGASASQNSQAFTTIKWAAFDDGKTHNNPKFPVGSDYCFLEHSGIQRDESEVDDQHHGDNNNNNNNESSDDTFGFSIQESIVREREVPSLAGFGLRRGEFHRTGIIILPTERRDVVQVSSILQMSLLGSDSAANKAALERLMLKRVEAVGRIDVLLERRRLSKMQFIHRDEWVADEDRKSCVVCVKPFSIRRRHHCRNCGEVVCSACAPPREVDVSSFGSALIRICTACVVAARSDPQQLQSGNQDVFVYHIRSTLSSRTSTNSSNLTNDGEDKTSGTSGTSAAMASGNIRPHSFSSDDSNFSIASEYPQQQSMAAVFQVHHHQPMHQHHNIATSNNNNNHSIANEFFDEDDDDNFDDYCIHDSQSSCDSSSYSFSDLNTFDDRFGSAIMKRLAAPAMPTRQRASTSSYSTNKNNNVSNNNYGRKSTQSSSSPSKHALYQLAGAQSRAPAPAYRHERSVYNPSKVVTHLLSNNNQEEEDDDDEEETKEPEVQVGIEPRDKRSSVDSLGSLGEFQDRIRGLQEDIFRTTTTTRFSDLEPAADSFSSDLASFHSDLLASSSSTNPLGNSAASAAKAAKAVVPSPPPSASPVSRPRLPPRPQRSASACSSPSTVDIDMLTSDSFSLVCPDLLQTQRRSSSVKQDAGETRRSRVSSLLRYSNSSVFDEGHGDIGGQQQEEEYEEEEEEEEEDSQSRDDLEALRLQVQGLHRSLEDATSKLNCYQSRTEATRARRTPSVDRRASGRSSSSSSRYRRGSVQSTTSNVSNTSNTSSNSSSGGSSQKGRNNDPVLGKRTESYDALVSELHEIMGLPTLSPRRTITSARGF